MTISKRLLLPATVLVSVGCSHAPSMYPHERASAWGLNLLPESLARPDEPPADAADGPNVTEISVSAFALGMASGFVDDEPWPVRAADPSSRSLAHLINDQDQGSDATVDGPRERAVWWLAGVDGGLVSNQATRATGASGSTVATSNKWPQIEPSQLIGMHPVDAVKHASIQPRLRKLLGGHYKKFSQRIAVASGVEKVGDYLVGGGCMTHACSTEEAAFAVNILTGASFAVVLSKNAIQSYGASPRGLPAPLWDWYVARGGKA